MKIRRIEIQGFKSFADRTSFEFGDGISAIVGPNGCGKSNVVDAIKWVLGDMSPRSLRGKKMQDVIFAGCRTRKALPQAQVTLVMDNEDGLLPTEHTEVSISRRLHRSGESTYLINKQVARLKDIRELFLDTGLGVDGNAIMEQGQIDALLAANPADRRGIFEEAAGISRYKQRRKESAQRLTRTEDNLERLRDVLELEEKRYRSLKAQAGRARRYQELRTQLEKTRVLRAVVGYRAVTRERDALAGQMEAVLGREQEAAERLQRLEQDGAEREVQREQAREAVHAIESRISEAAADERAARDRAAFAAQSIDELGQRAAHARQQAGQARERQAGLEAEQAELATEIEAREAELGEHTTRVEQAEQALSALEMDAARIRDAHDGAKREALAALGRIGEMRNAEAEKRTEAKQADERLRRLTAQQSELKEHRARVESEARELTALTAALETETRERAAALEAAETERANAQRAAEQARVRQAKASETRAEKAARLGLLERLAADREGVDQGAQRILDTLRDVEADEAGFRDGVLGLLAEQLDLPPESAQVLDRLLGHAAGALVVRSHEDALRWIGWLREQEGEGGLGERARFLCLDLVPDVPDDDIHAAETLAVLGELVAPPAIAALVHTAVGGTRVVDSLEEGVRYWRATGQNAVTPRGERVTASGALLGGHTAAGVGLVERGAEIKQLRSAIEALDAEVEAARIAAREAEGTVREMEQRLKHMRAELAERVRDHSRQGEALTRVEQDRERIEKEIAQLGDESTELVGFRDARAEEAATIQRDVDLLEEERQALEEQAEEAARGYLAVDQQRKVASERRMDLRVALSEARNRVESLTARCSRAADEARALVERAATLDAEASELEARVERARVEATEAEALARTRETERSEAGTALLEARKALAALEAAIEKDVGERESLRHAHDRLREELERFRLRENEFRVRIDALVERVRQDHDLDLAEVSSEAAESEEHDLDNLDLDAMEKEVEEIRRRLQALGNVNLNAITELEEVEQHVEFMRTQEQDLLQAKADLEKAIEELDELSTSRFAEAFEVIRENFREIFRRLFGGGRAEIVLEDASNLLETGIDIVARPPGKEQRTISLLSGGERTLTAVALLFAVFKAKPSPFSILDEVDAALDEANVRRLIGLVEEFTDRSQFLIVTHAKSTMEAADVLYGVTMEEAGVSKRVAVRLTDYPEAVSA